MTDGERESILKAPLHYKTWHTSNGLSILHILNSLLLMKTRLGFIALSHKYNLDLTCPGLCQFILDILHQIGQWKKSFTYKKHFSITSLQALKIQSTRFKEGSFFKKKKEKAFPWLVLRKAVWRGGQDKPSVNNGYLHISPVTYKSLFEP